MRVTSPPVPEHLAIIMDGNGRWAERAGLPRFRGHIAGARAMRAVVSHCAKAGVPQLTLYAFSCDNWSRPAAEVNALLDLFTAHFQQHTDSLIEHGIRLSVIGRRTRLPLPLRRAITDAERRTVDGSGMHLRVAIDYSSRAALEKALPARASAKRETGEHHGAGAHAIDRAPLLLPPVDLLLRTGGERRLSDFLLWECAYAELLFLDVLWPDITNADLDSAFRDYAQRDRRFGNVAQRVSA